MPRHKTLSDTDLLREARRLCAGGGAKALSYGNLARATGLAASTLAQRFASIPELQARAARSGWEDLILALESAEDATAGKGPQALLKALEEDSSAVMMLRALAPQDEEAAALAASWRERVETALTLRIGQGDKARLTAQILFAAWQGRALWAGDGFRLKDLVKRLT